MSGVRGRGRPGLVARFGLLSGVLIALLITSTGVVVQHLIADRTRTTAVALTTADVEFIEGLSLSQIITASSKGSADQLRQQFTRLTGRDFVAIDAFAPGTGRRIFSDDLHAVGSTDPVTAALTAASSGATSSRLIRPGGDGRLGALTARSGTVLVVYVPVRILGVEIAVAALYLRWEPYAASIRRDTMVLVGVLAAGGLLFYLALFRLFSRASRRLRDESQRNADLATHDPLTGLWNRPGLADLVEPWLREPVALMLIDLDRFKDVNDTLGHRHGDGLLTQIAHRMREVLGPSGQVGRIGGDEFVVVLREVAVAEATAERLLAALHRGFEVEGALLDVDASLGIALAPEHGRDFATLMQHADVAMYAAKSDGGGWAHYDPARDPNTPERLALVGELRRALAGEELRLEYQPIVRLADDGTTRAAAEALVRWDHPTRGLLAPDEFMDVAEQTGLVRLLTSVVLRQALAQAQAWDDDGWPVHLSVNVSARCIIDEHLVEEVRELLARHGLPGARLTIELTESGVLHDPARARRVLAGLAQLGVHLSLDDFGTGHSSLAHLQQLPLTEVKIDRSFVRDIATSRRDAAIVGACVQLATSLGLRTVAEGVEDDAALARLRSLDVWAVQGWHFSRALRPEALVPWFAAHAVPQQPGQRAANRH